MPELKVGSNFCECTGCGEFFFTVSSFDKHFARGRGGNVKCLKPEEMVKLNMEKDKNGYWHLAKGFGKG